MSKQNIIAPEDFFKIYDHLNYIAVDEDGEIDASDIKPEVDVDGWWSDGISVCLSDLNLTLPAKYTNGPWEKSLLYRGDFEKKKNSLKCTLVIDGKMFKDFDIENDPLPVEAFTAKKPMFTIDEKALNDSAIFVHRTKINPQEAEKLRNDPINESCKNGLEMYKICTSKNSEIERNQDLFDYYKKEITKHIFKKMFSKNKDGSYSFCCNGSDIIEALS